MRPIRQYRNQHMGGNNIPFCNRLPSVPQLPFWLDVSPQFMQGQHRPPLLRNPPPLLIQDQFRPLGIHPPTDRNTHNPRGKRQSKSEDGGSKGKKAKTDDSVSETQYKYTVPCSEGTEQITVSIWEYFLKSQMSDADLEKKLALRKTLHSIIKEAFPDSRLFIVGSSMTGFATRTSDVDMCLVLSDKYINQKKEAPVILTSVLKALRCCSFIQRPQVIRAKVPILKFRDKASGFECDININNTTGIRNTHLLRNYAHLDWRVRPLMLYIKYWARFHDINDASKKTISSYSLSLMLIHYLQAGVKPPILPSLQSLKPKLFCIKKDICTLSLEKEDIDFKSSNQSTLGELFLGFLDYYSNIVRHGTDVLSIRKGKMITLDDVDHTSSDWKFLCIEEPFEGTNTARSVYDHFVFRRILRVFNRSFRMLQQRRVTESILSCPF